ncbi:hypothetical protein [Spiractinospora alimapuensis]|uniref:hypothetical protein n=1 Tax=Spiractinospora alimapuensis TaxID=2820884 RepID=UPI001F2C9246|nr:hypothetical protein [Spiractinospora alimapuensis]
MEFARRDPSVSYRMLQDLERGKRSRFSEDVIAKVEAKLAWARGSIERLASGVAPVDLIPTGEGKVEAGLKAASLAQHIVRDLADDIAADEDLSPDEANELLKRALEQARTQALMIVHMERERRRRDR